MRLIILFFGFLIFLLACSPKVTEPAVSTESTPSEQSSKEQQEPDNPCITFAKLDRVTKDKTEDNYVLYRDFIKLKKYDAALPFWREAFFTAPAGNGKITYQFDDGIYLYKLLYDKAKDGIERKAFMDTIKSIYTKRMECFGDEAYISARIAFDNYYVFKELSDEEETYALFKKAIDEKGLDVDYFVINPFTKLLYDRIVSEEIGIDEGRKYALFVLNRVEKGRSECEGELCDAWDIINEYAPKRLEALEGIENFYSCEYYQEKYYPQFQANQTDCENIDEVLRKLLWGKCGEENSAVIELRNAKKTNCYTPPPPEGPLKRAFNAYNEGRFTDAIQLFGEFVERTEDYDKKGRYTLLIAKIYYRDIKDYRTARKYALNAASFKENWGEPYMLIGKLYASSGPLCGPGRGWDSQIVTWPAIDKFRYAKRIDPSVAQEANDWIARYEKYMPNIEDIFQRQIDEGSRFKVECWIQEWTTVRVVK